MPDTALPVTANYRFAPAPLTVEKLEAILTGIESEANVHPVDATYPTNSWVTHVYSASVKEPKADGYAILFDIPPVDDDGKHPVQVAVVEGADDKAKADNAAMLIGGGNEFIGYEDFAGQRAVVFRTTNAAPISAMAPTNLSWDSKPARKPWSDKLLSLLTPIEATLEKGQPDQFIPGYNTLSPSMKVKFWAELLIAMSNFESGWDPTNVFAEPPPLGVNSIGLLQLSKKDQGNYKVAPQIDDENKLKDPILNLDWGVTIFATLVAGDEMVASSNGDTHRGAARYWSVVRAGAKHKLEAIKVLTRRNVGL